MSLILTNTVNIVKYRSKLNFYYGEKKMKSEITYSILLFLIYRIVFYMTGISPNTAMYGLFVILLLFYYLTGNLNFNINKKRRYNSVANPFS